MLTSDGCDNGLMEGRMVQATVSFVKDDEVECDLEGGIPALIDRDHMSSSRKAEELVLRELCQRGQHLQARILDVESGRFVVRLTCRSHDLQVSAISRCRNIFHVATMSDFNDTTAVVTVAVALYIF
jgi:ribosomal protein S1